MKLKVNLTYSLTLTLLFLSFSLLIVTIVGHFQLIKVYSNDYSPTNEKIENIPVYSIDELLEYAEIKVPVPKGKEQKAMSKIFEVVIRRYRHRLANHNIFTNYLIWLAGILKRPWAQITDTELLLKYSNHGLCSQQAQTLVDIATKIGLKARIVGLNGHTVTEVFYNDRWHMFDPDYEIIPIKRERIYSVNELAENFALIEELYKESSQCVTKESLEKIAKIISSSEDNVFLKENTNICPRIYVAQNFLEILKWIIPFFCIGIASFLFLKMSKEK